MKIQNKLVYWNTLLFTAVFIIIGVLFLITYTRHTQYTIKQHLKNAANICAVFHMEEDELSPTDFAHVRDDYKTVASNSFYQVYGEDNSLRYGLTVDTVSSTILNHIRDVKAYYFEDDDNYAYGIFYEDNEGDFVVVTKENKDVLFSQQKTLAVLLLLGLLLSIVLIFFVSKIIARQAFKPFREINRAAISLIQNQKESLQLILPQTQDELYELISTLNEFLAQLEETGVIQKNFVRYVTHEFKTPIATIKGNLEVFLMRDRSPQEYNELAERLLKEVDGLTQIINTLLAISNIQTTQNSSLTMSQYALDVLVRDIVEKLKIDHAHCKVNIHSERANTHAECFDVRGNQAQVDMALSNLIGNAVKYSNGQSVDIFLVATDTHIKLVIKDAGIGIPKEQLPLISKPFYRADNACLKAGSGIGLSIALRILEKNGIKYQLDSVLHQGTTVTILFSTEV